VTRATKAPKRSKDSSKFKGAVDASRKRDEEELEGTGTTFDEDGPKRLVKLSDEEKEAGEQHLARMNIELRKVVQDAKDAATVFRADIKKRKEAIDNLSDDLDAGVRAEPAQARLL